MLNSVVRLCLVIVASLVLVGCGGGDGAKRVPVFKVTGNVTLKGEPLPQAIVTFSPKEGQPVAFGMSNDAGEFTLTTYDTGDGAAAGNYVVVVSKSAASSSTTDVGHSADPAFVASVQSGHNASTSPTSGSLIPGAYSDATKTPLKAVVDPDGENDFTFEIKE